MSGMTQVTQILHAIGRGDHQASEQLLAIVYQDLRRLAADLTLRGKPLGLPAILNLGSVYTTADFTTLVRSVYLNLLRLDQLLAALGSGSLPTVKNSWDLYISGYHALWQSSSNEKANWGLFGGLGLSDGNPSATVLTRSLTGVFSTDAVNMTGGTATFASKNVGTWTVTLTGFALGGDDAGNYALDSVATTSITARISPKTFTG